jgi:Ni,Fe-hydrogenase III small subunit
MVVPLRKTLEAVPAPQIVVSRGDCAIGGGIFTGAYGIEADLDEIVEVDASNEQTR